MRRNDDLNILPSIYYIGQLVSWAQFERLSNNTEYLSKTINFFARDKMEILYSINTHNIAKKGIVLDKEIQVLRIPTAADNIKEETWKNFITAIQRGIPYNLIMIFAYKSKSEKYKVAVTVYHGESEKKFL